MVNKIRNGQGLIHYHTSGTTSGDIKKPTANQLYIGEIAINNNIEQPSLFIKNSSGGVTQFVDKEYIDNALAGKADKPEPNYLCFTAEANNVQIGMKQSSSDAPSVTIQYSTDKVNWTDFTPDETDRYFCTLNTGDKVYLKGNVDTFGDVNLFRFHSFISTGNFTASGSIDSLRNFSTTLTDSCYFFLFFGCTGLTSASELELPATTLADYCYFDMFNGCTSLITAPKLLATTLANYCYFGMFEGCTSLTTAPELPATTLAQFCYNTMFIGCTSLTTAPELLATMLTEGCYSSMFQNCTSLTTAPELPATTLAQYCYASMFNGCTSLTTAPELPATTLAKFCYMSMFQGCTSLTTAPELPATTLADYCYTDMFNGCTSLTTAPELPATTLADSCYQSMFNGCTSLTTAPELPATTLANSCYYGMFEGCSSLNNIVCLATNRSASNCTNGWVANVAATGTFIKNPSMSSWTTGSNGIPTGWTVEDYVEIVPNSLNSLVDVSTNNPSSGQSLVYDGTNWVNQNVPSIPSTTVPMKMVDETDGQTYTYNILYTTKEPNYLCFTAEDDNVQIGMKQSSSDAPSVTIQYSTDKVNWTDFTPDETDRYFCTLNTGDKVYLKGNVEAFFDLDNEEYNYFISTGNFKASGSIDSLRNFSTTLTDACYYSLFDSCTGLTSASKLELPATTLADSCYSNMFAGCTSLTTAPELPATTLASNCYNAMFYDCTSLITAPELPATTLAEGCYVYMFNGCTSLTTAPELPATTLAEECYYNMFQNCTSLTTAPKIHATAFTQNCCQYMFDGCTSLNHIECLATNIGSSMDRYNWVQNVAATGTFVKNPNTTGWPRGNSGIPTGWAVEDYVEIVPNSLNSLVDVSTANPTSGQSLVYNGTNWVNQNVSGGGNELTSNKVTSISSASTNTQYPSAKCVYDEVKGNLSFVKSQTLTQQQKQIALNNLGIADETVNVTLVCENMSAINGVIVTMEYGGNTTTQTWTGSTLVFVAPMYEEYTISFSNVVGYYKPDSVTKIGKKNFTRNITVYYLTALYTDLSMLDYSGGTKTNRETANCYIIKNNGYYELPLVYGCAIMNGQTNSASYTQVSGTYTQPFYNYLNNQITSPFIEEDTDSTAVSAEVVLCDSSSFTISGIYLTDRQLCKYLRFNVESVPELGANATIAIKDAGGQIMWSWHLWACPYTVSTFTHNNGNVTYNIMDVNLGWVKESSDSVKGTSPYYQWGRKDPMLRSGANAEVGTFTITSCAPSVAAVIQHPTTFNTYESTHSNWWMNNDTPVDFFNYWDASKTSTGNSDKTVVKTVYDPSPSGFHIPCGNTFLGFSTSNGGTWNNGWTWDGNHFQAAGARNSGNGGLGSVGSTGNYWLVSSNSQRNAYSLGFGSGYVGPQYAYGRASGFSVRPVARQ